MACGSGEDWQTLWRASIGGTTEVAADTQPTPYQQGHMRVWLRGSRVNLPVGSNLAADWLKAANCLHAFDEVVTTALDGYQTDWWESVLPMVGSNDGGGAASQVVVFVAGNPSAPLAERFLRAALLNPKVILGVEGYHQGGIYTSMTDIRAEEKAWLARVQSLGGLPRSALGLSVADAPWYAASNPAYCSCSDLARDADEEAVFDWMSAGCPHLFTWGYGYATDRSKWMAADAVYRGIRRRWGAAP